jgi:hypothetical protein
MACITFSSINQNLFLTQKILNMNIESFEVGCQQLGLDPENCRPDLSTTPEKYRKALMATFEMYVICEASREGVPPNWNDGSERKWTPWFDMEVDKNNPSGFRFFASYYSYTNTITTSGSRLCYRTEAESDWHAKHHIDKYRDMMVLPK